MPGAVITIDQARPGPSTSAGSPGVARNDIWQSWLVTLLDGAGGNQSWEWQLLYIPPGSAVTLAGADGQGVAHTSSTTFTPDLHGSYRIRLITNGGGPGNIQILVIRVRFDNTGALIYHGWALPAFGEQDGESNYNGNLVAWAEVFDYIFADIQTRLTSLEATAFHAGGDLSGSSSSQTVVGIRGGAAPPTPLLADVGKVIAVTAAGVYGLRQGFTPGGDLGGNATSQIVIGLQGRAVKSQAPTDGQQLTWVNGATDWEPVTQGPRRIYGVSQTVSTTQSSGPVIVSYFELDPSVYPAAGRTIKLKCVIQSSSVSATCQLKLVDDTDTVVIHSFTSALITPDYQSATLTTTVGTPTTDTIANSEKRYYVSLQRSGGLSSDAVTVHNCYLEVSYS